MANSFFAFKQFIIQQDQCAMKVGTDGVLLGAWADVSGANKILDIGTGTGLIALMVAQRSDAEVCALEIDKDAAGQAAANVSNSPWSDRITISQGDFKHYDSEGKYDVILSNPPYFKKSLQSPDRQRSVARHDEGLTFYDLITRAAKLLAVDGHLSLVVPSCAEEEILEIAVRCDLFPHRKTYVRTTPEAEPKRLLLALGFGRYACSPDYLTVEMARHIYSDDYVNLTKDYYLKM